MNQDKQPEALQLAEWLDAGKFPYYAPQKSAAELRRLHAENEVLRSELYEAEKVIDAVYKLEENGFVPDHLEVAIIDYRNSLEKDNKQVTE